MGTLGILFIYIYIFISFVDKDLTFAPRVLSSPSKSTLLGRRLAESASVLGFPRGRVLILSPVFPDNFAAVSSDIVRISEILNRYFRLHNPRLSKSKLSVQFLRFAELLPFLVAPRNRVSVLSSLSFFWDFFVVGGSLIGM